MKLSSGSYNQQISFEVKGERPRSLVHVLRLEISDKKAVQTLVEINKWEFIEFILLLIIQSYISDKHFTAEVKSYS